MRSQDDEPSDRPDVGRIRKYSCPDGYCGADDCERCRPGCTAELAAQAKADEEEREEAKADDKQQEELDK